MSILLNLDLLVADEDGAFNLQQWVGSLPDEEFAVSALTVAELWHGMERANGATSARREVSIEAMLDYCTVLPYTIRTAQAHAHLWSLLPAGGTPLKYYDLIVAATALEGGHTLAVLDGAGFDEIPGLKLLLPTMAER